MVNFQRKERYDWEDLLTIMRILRAPGGCPWDREQTHQSIRRNFLEETYEALDAIDRDSAPDMQEELFCFRWCSMPPWRRSVAALPRTM